MLTASHVQAQGLAFRNKEINKEISVQYLEEGMQTTARKDRRQIPENRIPEPLEWWQRSIRAGWFRP